MGIGGKLRAANISQARRGNVGLADCHPNVRDWRDRTVAVSSTIPSHAISAVDTFVKSMRDAWQFKMRLNTVILVLAANDLTGAIVPLVRPAGITVSNSGFINSDYSLSTGLGSNPNTGKRLTTNYLPSVYLSQGEGMVSAYCRTNRQETGYPAAISAEPSSGGDPRMLLHLYTDPNSYWDCWDFAGTGRTIRSFSNSLGLVSGIRFSNASSAIFQRGAQVGAANTSVVSTSPPSETLGFFRGNNTSLPFETRTFSYFYAGKAITVTEEALHYQENQRMQGRLGRAV